MLAVLKNNALICVKEDDLKGHTHKWQIVKLLITRCIHNGHKKKSQQLAQVRWSIEVYQQSKELYFVKSGEMGCPLQRRLIFISV